MCHACCFGLNPGWKKIRFQLALNKTFCPTPQHLTHRQLKHSTKEQKSTKQYAFCLPFIGFPDKVHNIRTEKQISIPF